MILGIDINKVVLEVDIDSAVGAIVGYLSKAASPLKVTGSALCKCCEAGHETDFSHYIDAKVILV